MTTHVIHAPIPEAGLADGCERCAQHSQTPMMSLDQRNLRLLIERVEADEMPRSDAEERAMEEVRLFKTLRRRWEAAMRDEFGG